MRGELYRRWLADERGLTLSEFVAERRAEVRQARSQRRFSMIYGPQMQQASPEMLLQQYAGMQQHLRPGQYSGPLGGVAGLLAGLLR